MTIDFFKKVPFKTPFIILSLAFIFSILLFNFKYTNTQTCALIPKTTTCNNPAVGSDPANPEGKYPLVCDPTMCHFWAPKGSFSVSVTCSQYKPQASITIVTDQCDNRTVSEICSGATFATVYAQSEISNGCNQTLTNPSLEPYCGDGFCTGGESFGSCPSDCTPIGGHTICSSGGCDNEYENGSIDFTINPISRTVGRNGAVALYNIELYGQNIYSGAVTATLNVTNCPPNSTCAIDGSSSVVYDSSNSDTFVTKLLRVTTTASTPVNTHNFNVNLNYLNQSKQKTAYLVVQDYNINPTLFIDYPTDGANVSGILNVTGWAIDNQYTVESAISSRRVYVDNVFVGNATAYSRPDVCLVYPGRSGCPNVGFGYSINTTTLSNGSHTIRFEATDSDTVPKTATLSRTINVNNSTSGTIQGYKVKSTNFSTTDNPPSSQTVTLNGASPTTANPFSFSNITLGSNYTVAVTVPSGWTSGYTLCYGNSSCHSNTPTSGSSVTVNIPSSLPLGQRYADLWWHLTPPINTAPVITLNGSNPTNITVGAWTDPGATATDAQDGNLTSAITTSGTVNTSVPGTYTRTYSVTDSGGLTASVSRTINVTNSGSFTLTVSRSTGGRVNSADGFINCGSVCSAVYAQNTNVTLTATPLSAQWLFVGWGGACSGTNASCVVNMSSSRNVTAEFRPRPFDYQEF